MELFVAIIYMFMLYIYNMRIIIIKITYRGNN
jgi:hypothetical protein